MQSPADRIIAVRRAWNRWWFDAANPMDLGVSRAVYCGLLFLWYAFVHQRKPLETVADVFYTPNPLFQLLHIPLARGPLLGILGDAWLVAVALTSIGLFTRWSAAAAFFIGLVVWGTNASFAFSRTTAHNFAFLIPGILALGRSGDAFSLDALRRRREHQKAPTPSGEYRWPIRMAWMCLALVLFSGGFDKLHKTGLAWVFSDNLRNAILLANSRFQFSKSDPTLPMGYGWRRTPCCADGPRR